MYYVEKQLLLFIVTQPAPGAEWSYLLPAGAIYEIFAVKVTLTTSAVVATRVVGLQFSYGKQLFFQVKNPQSHPASSTFIYIFAPGLTATAVEGDTGATPIPTPTILRGETVIGSITTGLQAADQYSAITLYAHVVPCKEEEY